MIRRGNWASWVVGIAGSILVIVGVFSIVEKTIGTKALSLEEASAVTLAGMALLFFIMLDILLERIDTIVLHIKDIRGELESKGG